MYKIGEFSEITEVPVKTLRYYDEINVLKPNCVDRYSGYRFYDERNIHDCEFVKTAKVLGCSLEEIRNHVLENGHEVTSEFLDQCEEKIQQNIQCCYTQLNYISTKREEIKLLSPQKKLIAPWLKNKKH